MVIKVPIVDAIHHLFRQRPVWRRIRLQTALFILCFGIFTWRVKKRSEPGLRVQFVFIVSFLNVIYLELYFQRDKCFCPQVIKAIICKLTSNSHLSSICTISNIWSKLQAYIKLSKYACSKLLNLALKELALNEMLLIPYISIKNIRSTRAYRFSWGLNNPYRPITKSMITRQCHHKSIITL